MGKQVYRVIISPEYLHLSYLTSTNKPQFPIFGELLPLKAYFLKPQEFYLNNNFSDN